MFIFIQMFKNKHIEIVTIYGKAGCGKTTSLSKIICNDTSEYIVLAPTNSAVETIYKTCIENKQLEREHFKTIYSFFRIDLLLVVFMSLRTFFPNRVDFEPSRLAGLDVNGKMVRILSKNFSAVEADDPSLRGETDPICPAACGMDGNKVAPDMGDQPRFAEHESARLLDTVVQEVRRNRGGSRRIDAGPVFETLDRQHCLSILVVTRQHLGAGVRDREPAHIEVPPETSSGIIRVETVGVRQPHIAFESGGKGIGGFRFRRCLALQLRFAGTTDSRQTGNRVR